MRIDKQITGLEKDITLYEGLLINPITLQMCNILFSDFIERKKNRLNKLKEYRQKTAIPEFEKLSAGCNMQMDKIIEKAKRYIGKEPLFITNSINELVNKYDVEKDRMEQEEKNGIYVRLIQHINFLTTKYKNK